jgi:predicted nucleic acid-binding protein
LRISFDTNLLVYADGGGRVAGDEAKKHKVLEIVGSLIAGSSNLFVAAQTLIELHDVLVRKQNMSRNEAAACVSLWREQFTVLPTTDTVLDLALTLSYQHKLRIFDAVILAAAAEARCDQLLSEDFHDGFVWRGVEVVNPFTTR